MVSEIKLGRILAMSETNCHACYAVLGKLRIQRFNFNKENDFQRSDREQSNPHFRK